MTPLFREKHKACGESGFTLLEIIISMVIVGIMVAVAGMGIVTGMKGFLFTKENAHMSQKAQIAMARLSRELLEFTNIDNGLTSSTSISYERPGGYFGISQVGDTVKIREGSAVLPDADNGDILIGDVSSFTLSYFKDDADSDGEADPWDPATDSIRRLAAIKIELGLIRSESGLGTIDFSTTINPRNNKNYGGVPPTTTPPAKADYGCFVATVVFERPDHPMVSLLREFRDRILSPWAPGRVLIRAYYAGGPKLADLIKDRPWARFTARLVLLPFCGAAFLALHFPALIPLLLLLSWFAAQMGCTFFKDRHNIHGHLFERSRGSILIALIITMVVLSSIGGAMLSLTSTSTMSRVMSNSSEKAYLLAESGYRYAASRYLNAGGEDARDETLDQVHNQTFTLRDNNGQFKLEAYPYFFKTADLPPAPLTSILRARVLGGFPSSLTVPSTGRLKVDAEIYDYSSSSLSGDTLTFILTSSQTGFWGGIDILPVATCTEPGTKTVNQGDSIRVNANHIKAFPGKNGLIAIELADGTTRVCSYEKADLSTSSLMGIEDPRQSPMASFTVTTGDHIILQKFAEIHATGIFGQAPMQTERRVVYHTPLPIPGGAYKEEFKDTFEDTANLEEPALGTHGVETIGGDSALKVTGTGDVPGTTDDKGSLINLDWARTNVNLAQAHRIAGNFLSYDAQVKIGFDPEPTWNNIMKQYQWTNINGGPFPEYYMAGISFRQKESGESYGLSFVRGDSDYIRGFDGISDGIPDGFVPRDNYPMIVLWQQTGAGPDREWLAYSHLEGRLIKEFSSLEWTSFFPWALPGTICRSGPCWHYPATSGVTSSIISASTGISGTTEAVVSFWHWYDLNDCTGKVLVSFDFGDWLEAGSFTGNLGTITEAIPAELDISSLIPVGASNIRVRFRVEPGTGPGEWQVDDVRINEIFPLQEATLLVRIKEAASVNFSLGSGDPIEDGDYIFGTLSGARARVVGDPIVTSGSWALGNAAGIITLNNVSGNFYESSTEIIRVVGSLATSARATGFRARDNYIKAYVGDPDGLGTPNSTPLDMEKHGHPRGTFKWPPDEVEDTAPENDYFTLVQWNPLDLNPTVSPPLALLGEGLEENAIIRSNAITTTDSGLFTEPEIGLHTFGYSSTNVYFDDFAIQAVVSPTLATAPIQE